MAGSLAAVGFSASAGVAATPRFVPTLVVPAATSGHVDRTCNKANNHFDACTYFNTKQQTNFNGKDTMIKTYGTLASSGTIKKLILGVGYQALSCRGCNPLEQHWTNWAISVYPNGDGALSGNLGYFFGCNDYAYRPLMRYEYLDPTPKPHYVTMVATGAWYTDFNPCTAFNP